MYKDSEHWCHSCIDCAMMKTPRNKSKAPLLPILIEGAFDRLAVDVVEPFPISDNVNWYIAGLSDYYTRWPEAFALPSTEAPCIALLLIDEILSRHGAPRTLLSDRGLTVAWLKIYPCTSAVIRKIGIVSSFRV